jgi:hypothetical protein
VIHPTQDQQKIHGVGEDDKSSSTASQEEANMIHSLKVTQARKKKKKKIIDEHSKGAEPCQQWKRGGTETTERPASLKWPLRTHFHCLSRSFGEYLENVFEFLISD